MTDTNNLREVVRWLPLLVAGLLLSSVIYLGQSVEVVFLIALALLQVMWIGVPWAVNRIRSPA